MDRFLNSISHQFLNDQCIFCGLKKPGDISLRFSNDSNATRENPQILSLVEEYYQVCPKAFLIYAFLAIGFLAFLLLPFGYVPSILAVAVFGKLSMYQYSKQFRWLYLKDIEEEYKKIEEVLAKTKKLVFKRQIDEIMRQLFTTRSKVVLLIPLVAEETQEEISMRINLLEIKVSQLKDQELERIYQAQIKDLKDKSQKIQEILEFLDKYLTNKESILTSLQLLRTKFLLAETTGDEKEIQDSLNELKALHNVYERITNNLKI